VSCAEGVGENGKQQLKAELVGMLTQQNRADHAAQLTNCSCYVEAQQLN